MTDEVQTNVDGNDSVIITTQVPAQTTQATTPALSGAVQSFLQNPSLEMLKTHAPHLAARAEERMLSLDPDDHLAIARFGEDSLESMTSTAMSVFRTLQDDKGAEISSKIMQAHSEMKTRTDELKQRLKKRREARAEAESKLIPQAAKSLTDNRFLRPIVAPVEVVVDNVLAPLGRLGMKALSKITDPKGIKAAQKEQELTQQELKLYETIILSQSQDSEDILQAAAKTADDLTKLQLVLEGNKDRAPLIYQQMQETRKAAMEARDFAYIDIVVLNEHRTRKQKQIAENLQKAETSGLTIQEAEQMAVSQRSVGLMNQRETRLVGTLTTTMIHMMQAEMDQNTTVDLALERESQESLVIGHMTTSLAQLMTQNSLIGYATTLQLGNKMAEEATRASANGMMAVLEARKKVDQSIVSATNAIADAADNTVEALGKFIKQDQERDRALKEARSRLEGSAQNLATVLSGIEESGKLEVVRQVTAAREAQGGATKPKSLPKGQPNTSLVPNG